jgi:glycerophosphoryl diester phosphodiesterase
MSEAYSPIIVAHRGLHQQFPENSVSAFRAARDAGVAWVECDVWPSADGTAVVLHDETLDRTTTGSGPVWRQSWSDLRSLRLRRVDGRTCPDEPLPNLTDLAAVMNCGSRPAGLLVEVKPPDAAGFVREVIDLLKNNSHRWIVQSFDESNLIHALAHDPATPHAFLVEDREALGRGVANGWKHIHLCHDLLDAPTARMLRDRGISIGVWTVNTPEDLRRVMDLRADMIITDEPVLAAELLRRQ